MWGVMRFYNLLRIGITWKGPEVIELWYNLNDSDRTQTTNTSSRGGGCGGTGSDSECFLNENFDDDDDSFDYTMSDIEDCDTDLANLEDHSPMNRSRKYRVRSQLEVIDELEKSANSGSEEDDSLLVAYDSNSVGSVWQKEQHVRNIVQWTCMGLLITVEIYAQLVILF